jgi:hypothetical protein
MISSALDKETEGRLARSLHAARTVPQPRAGNGVVGVELNRHLMALLAQIGVEQL